MKIEKKITSALVFFTGGNNSKTLNLKGFTLVELLIATTILVLTIVGLLLLFINCLFLNEANRNLTRAMGHTQYVMEEIKNTTYSSIVSTYNGVCWDATAITSRGLAALSNESICMTVTGTTLLTVTVTTTWRDRGVRLRTTALQSRIAQP